MSFWDGTRWIRESELLPPTTKRPLGRRAARIRDLIATAVIGLGLVAAVVPFVPTSAGGPLLTLAPEKGAAGESVQLSGRDFVPKTRLQVTWDEKTSRMPTVQVNGTGTFQVSIVVPSGPTGPHTVAVLEVAKGNKKTAQLGTVIIATVTFSLTAAAVTPTPTTATTPTPAPTAAPTAEPTAAPTAEPKATTAPTATPSPTPTSAPSATPEPTTAPTPTATAAPSDTPSSTASPTPVATAPPSTNLSEFVVRCGVGLCLGGRAYRFTGLNIYNANSRDNCWYPLGYDNGALDDALTSVGPGQEAFRAWFFQDLATSGGLRDWSAFDHTIAVARAHGVRIIATLADQWGSCDSGPGSAVFKGDAWYTTDYRSVVSPGSTRTYRNWVAEIVARYKDEPTILAWQLMNEAETKHDITTTCTTNGAAILRTWAADVSGIVKTIDPNHLVSLGTLGGGQCGTQDAEYQFVHDLPTIDLCEYHDYLSGAMPGDVWNGLAHRIAQCASLGKPIFIGESGQKDMSLADRAAVFGTKFSTQFGSGVVGELVWALRVDSQGGSSTTNFDVGPNDPTITLFGEY
jgi:outer membrane biosynthesis protein TonB